MIDASILTNIAQGPALSVAIRVRLLVESVLALAPPTLTTVLLLIISGPAFCLTAGLSAILVN